MIILFSFTNSFIHKKASEGHGCRRADSTGWTQQAVFTSSFICIYMKNNEERGKAMNLGEGIGCRRDRREGKERINDILNNNKKKSSLLLNLRDNLQMS